MGFWNISWTRRAESWLNHDFTANQVPEAAERVVIQKDAAYVNIWLKSARVVNVRSGLKRFYGAVHSRVTLTGRAEDKEVQINTVVAPEFLKNLDAKNLDRVVSFNHRLLGPIAHSGNDVRIEVGLFSIKEENLVAPYLGMLEKLSNVAGVGFISTAIQLAGPIQDGVDAILGGGGDSILEIGLARTFDPLQTGFYLVMRATDAEVDKSALKLSRDDWKVLGGDGKPVKDFPYMVLEVSATSEKHDWAGIPELKRQYNVVKEAIRRGDTREANAAQITFRRLALTASELIPSDAERLAKLVKDEVDRALGAPVPHAGFVAPEVKEFAQLGLYDTTGS